MKKTGKTTVTITFGDQAENHVGMQKLGKMATDGFSVNDLEKAKIAFEKIGCICELIDLNNYLPDSHTADAAALLIVRNGVNGILSKNTSDKFLKEQLALDWDSKAKMYGRVVNKHARHNLCYADYAQEPDYENGKGRIVDFKQTPILGCIRNGLEKFIGEKAKNLMAEGNLYYDTTKCGIGYHGDAERRRVIAIRLGESMPIHYQWFLNSRPVGETAKLMLHHGDLYIMSEKAVGTDWKKKKALTLRHAAGCAKFLKL